MRSSEEQVAKEAMDKEVVRRRRRGRPKTRWKDRMEADLLEKGLNERNYENINNCRKLIGNRDPNREKLLKKKMCDLQPTDTAMV